jgi:hypothetical protein
MTKIYLGDSVYLTLEPEHDAIRLTTENGLGASNTIILDRDTRTNLRDVLARLDGEPAEGLGRRHE